MDIRQYRYYKGAWIFLEEDKEKLLTKKESGDLLKKGGLFVRNIYEFDCKEKTSFWFIIKDEIEDISELPFSARRNIRRALKFYNIRKINLKEFSEIGFPIITSAQKSYKIKCHVINKNEFDEIIKKYENENDKEFWIVEKKENKEAVAIAINRIKENSCEYDDMKCKPEA